MPNKLGRTTLQLTMISTDSLNSDVNLTETLTIDVSVIKTKRMIDKIFNITLFLVVGLLSTRPGMCRGPQNKKLGLTFQYQNVNGLRESTTFDQGVFYDSLI